MVHGGTGTWAPFAVLIPPQPCTRQFLSSGLPVQTCGGAFVPITRCNRDTACRHAFAVDDVNQVMHTKSAGSDGLVLSIHAVPRVVVEPSMLRQAVINPPSMQHDRATRKTTQANRFYSSVKSNSFSFMRSELDGAGNWLAEREYSNSSSPFYGTNEPGKEWMAIDLGGELPVAGVVTQVSGEGSPPFFASLYC